MRLLILILMIILDISLICMHHESMKMALITICLLCISALIIFVITAFDEDLSRMREKDDDFNWHDIINIISLRYLYNLIEKEYIIMKFDTLNRRQVREYKRNYDNRTYRFICSLDPAMTLKQIAVQLDVSYFCIYSSYKNDRIAYSLKKKILDKFNLTDAQVSELNEIVAGWFNLNTFKSNKCVFFALQVIKNIISSLC